MLSTMMVTLACTSPLAQDDAGTTTHPGTADDEATDDDDDASEATGSGTSTMGTSTSTSTNTTTTNGEESFLIENDVYVPVECDPFVQDCPEGEKCVPYSANGEWYDANRCVPVLGDQAPGEDCTWTGIIEAIDDCDATSICWNTELVGDQYVGTCVAQCTGSAENPLCENGSNCTLSGDGPLALCLPTCDPLVQDCDEGYGCYWGNFDFNCITASQNIPTGEPCGFVNDCTPGHLCVDAAALPSCAGASCCTSYCNLPDGDAGCVAQPGTACVSFFEEGTAPEGLEHVGVCLVPG
jgi:hypothetical protein